MLTTNEIPIGMQARGRFMMESHEAPNSAKPAIYEDILLLGSVIEPTDSI